MRDRVVRENTRIPLVLLTQAQYEVHMSEKSLGTETYREIDVSDCLVQKTNTVCGPWSAQVLHALGPRLFRK